MKKFLPPHPFSSLKIQRKDLNFYESQKIWIAQRKFNGTNIVIHCNDKFEIWGRNGEKLNYSLTSEMIDNLKTLKLQKETVLNGELLHTKAVEKRTKEQAAKDTIVLFDILYYDKFLTDITQIERLNLLREICNDPKKLETPKFLGAIPRALVIQNKLWLAEFWENEFCYHFDECCFDQNDKNGNDLYPEIEGLILRLKGSKIKVKNGDIGDVNWMIRCRKKKEKVYDY